MSALGLRLGLAFAVAVVAAGVAARVQLGDIAGVVEIERRMLAGEDIAANGVILTNLYNRILFPFVFVQAMRLLPAFDPGHLFVALRFASFLLCFALMFSSIDRRAARAGVDPVATCLAVGLAFTASLVRHPEPHTSDIFDLALMFYVFLNIVEGRTGIAFALACLTAVNRESGAFAGIAYFLLRAGTERPGRLVANSLLLVLVPYALAIGVRRLVYQGTLPATDLGQFFTGLPLNLATLWTDLVRFNPGNDFYLLVAMTVLAVVPFARRPAPADYRLRIALAVTAIAVVSLLFGLVREIRIFLPCVALLAAGAVADLAPPRRERGLSSA